MFNPQIVQELWFQMANKYSGRFAILGLGRFGYKLSLELSQGGADVVVLDHDMNRVEQIKDDVSEAICVDCTDEHALTELGLEHVDVAIVGFGDEQEVSILATAILRDLGIPTIIARARSELHQRILSRMGASRVIDPENDAAEELARSLLSLEVVIKAELAEGFQVAEVQAPKTLWGRSVGQLRFRQRFGLLIIGIHRPVVRTGEDGTVVNDFELLPSPGPDQEIISGDRLLVVGKPDSVTTLGTLTDELPPVV